ncbi:TPA: replicative DNA helicase [Candidatus Saccharibacteria bacterium]|nr:replicative DNA helicase [Candidatus Saccharibacteria bacterium]HIO87344.1 replicative DNA helicase [Candidatus Saccharibacteria bacterium]
MADPKIPPQNIEAEKSLIGSILLDSDTLVRIGDVLVAEDFYEQRHQTIYETILDLYEKRRPIDVLTISNRLKEIEQLEIIGGSAYLTDLVNGVPTATHAPHYAEIVHKKGTLRRLIQASSDIINLGYDESAETGELLSQAEERLFKVSQQNIRQDISSIEEILDGSFERLDELHKNKGGLRGIATGFNDLDNKLAGLQRSDMIVLAARPAMGKTTLALNIAQHVATKERQPVLIFSLEMSKEQLVDRMLSAESGIDAWNLRTGRLTDADFQKLGEAMGSLSEAPIFIDDTPGISALEMRTKARREQHKHNLGLIIIDYLQLMSGSTKSDGNRVQEISEISRGIKALARELNVPVIALSQLSRTVEQRSPQIPQLSDLRESGSIEQDADLVMFVYREDYYNEETERRHITDLIIGKHRNGPTGKVELFFHPEQLAFRNLDRRHESVEIPAEL